MASGSLSQYLNITYEAKVGDTADDIEGTLFNYIPPSKSLPRLMKSYVNAERIVITLLCCVTTDYTKSAETFADTVTKDAENFVPPGKMVASYRSAGDEEDEVEYGIWHVGILVLPHVMV
jgi:hypothetical protein